ncbi:uncharacterized protein LOC134275305 [Saccostrea cucullata]|uniref:uncharacterized protein LOC134275305 n=1 Tax=Saccostrea cuccullata TaxID=36930 RepID=UPI002ED1F5C3
MLRAKRTTKSPYARPGRAPAATKKAKASRPTSTVTQPNQVTTATSTVTQPNQVTPDAIPPALSNQPTTSSGIDIPDPLEFEASPTMLSPGTSGSTNTLSNSSATTPNSLCSVSDALGVHVPDNLRQNIYDNAFIHLHKLLPLKPNDEPQQQLAFVAGELVLKAKHKEIKITSTETWTNAFLIFSSIYLTKFPEHIQSILKYINIIRTAAQRSSNLNWLNYDIQFRLKRSRNHTLDWGCVDAELWLLYVSHGHNTLSQQTPNYTSKSPKCFDFNYKGTCGRPYCTYQHACIKCSNNHPLINCRWHNSQAFRTENFRPSQAEHPRQPPSRFQSRGFPPNQPRPLGLGPNPSQR